MDPNWRSNGIDLYRLLHDQTLQYAVIHLAMRDLRHADSVQATDWLGNPPPPPSGSKRRRPVGNTLPDLLMTADAEDGTAEDNQPLFAPLVDAAEALIQENAETPHMSTWMVLYFLLVCDSLKEHVCRGTPPNVAHVYFQDFDARISRHVCGSICYTPKGGDKRAKSGNVLKSAISPVEAVAVEWLYLDSIIDQLARNA